MAVHPFKPFVDFRSAASRTPSPEAIVVVNGIALLAEAPADPSDPATPMAVTVGGAPRTRVLGTPAAGQYRVRVSNTPAGPEWIPELEFHASDEGLTGTCDYYRTGTIVTALRWEAFQAFLDPLHGIADESTLNALYPPTADRTQPGRAGRLAFTVDGGGWVSDGSVWTQLAGMAKWSAQQLAASILGASHDSIWTPPGAALTGAVLEQAILAVAQDGAFALPGLVTELASLGVTADGVVADYGAISAAATLAAGQDGVWAAGGPTFPFSDDFSTDQLATMYTRPVNSSGWAVTGGKLQYTASSAAGTCLVNAAAPSDGYVEAVIQGNTGSNFPALLARYTDENNAVKVYLDFPNHGIVIAKYVAGTFSQLQSYIDAVNIVAGADNTVRLTYTGTSFTVTLNGTVRLTQTISDSVLQGSKYAGAAGYAGTITFDNLAVH